MQIKITRRKRLLSVGNSWSDYINYWLINGQIVNDENTFFKRFKFVAAVNFSADGWDEEEQREKTEPEMLEEIEFCYLDLIRSFDDCAEFFDVCNQSIESYNDDMRRLPICNFA